MGDATKDEDRRRVEERIRAHIREAMAGNGWGLRRAAVELRGDPGALSDCLSGKPKAPAPSLWLTFNVTCA